MFGGHTPGISDITLSVQSFTICIVVQISGFGVKAQLFGDEHPSNSDPQDDR
jgi:hypothetical protein